MVQERAGLLASARKRSATAPSVHSNHTLVEPAQVSRVFPLARLNYLKSFFFFLKEGHELQKVPFQEKGGGQGDHVPLFLPPA